MCTSTAIVVRLFIFSVSPAVQMYVFHISLSSHRTTGILRIHKMTASFADLTCVETYLPLSISVAAFGLCFCLFQSFKWLFTFPNLILFEAERKLKTSQRHLNFSCLRAIIFIQRYSHSWFICCKTKTPDEKRRKFENNYYH